MPVLEDFALDALSALQPIPLCHPSNKLNCLLRNFGLFHLESRLVSPEKLKTFQMLAQEGFGLGRTRPLPNEEGGWILYSCLIKYPPLGRWRIGLRAL